MIDLTPGSLEVLLNHADTPPTVRYYREAVLVAPDLRIVPYHVRFFKTTIYFDFSEIPRQYVP